MSQIAAQIAKIQLELDEKVQRLADDYREKVMLPICRKLKTTYLAGMGKTVFYVNDNPNLSMECVDDVILFPVKKYKGLMAVFDILNIPVRDGNVFGYYVADITRADIGMPKDDVRL